ncbi:bifunctional tRNA (5-methylaminomethyl-2-thiouridine)(34)-methyltransferase MnmD/FAD-dependent 5-carboxymethylaminomethyl-2-thiouridine(34) oxidoreductase MnmC [Salinivibrio sp. ML290]|uniref:bifunctional tRNA (5-methylaminomethyl-2-thiouridine)(34)-methyltransferase MnmD/FAD-dependent 5-carboxymethylaminomethyl-2-thiouridine(34) oxidoreductase MnmC n=1 Tax=Salinivibrio sp. ML290 TaxID=1909468 RepID=UPI0009887FA9|nr:bifunctional tRNA (5-methylaminomethyl-2-thiouridine)(34)-methyltransferase MnmD/FAD-dependent 5-carboxymethylaminomethyl-2-thiouridine(34) oxidoreductase MnmC [Salinivibrio sp. ML290]OOE75032.1 bifunctional tRNA (5-methylaminomethyl-2-thiouridine)(34)-methyltransferase MnmD/FAD-dependent 5-carboxymethylaminomethyl-2-thiouridine(34) oxidoreductase MnmC [Salinivibrio sp. ML290]
MSTPSIDHAKISWNDTGTPVAKQFDDVYFSNHDGLAETRYVFIEQNQLPARWQTATSSRFVIAETGFGTGLNFLATWAAFEQFRQIHPNAPVTQLHFISFEKYPLTVEDLARAHQAWPELASYAEQLRAYYPVPLAGCQRIVLAQGQITLDLWFGDIKDWLPQVPTSPEGIVDAWYLDGFAPSKNPEMWNQALFNGMARLAREQCTCATFTAAGFVRRGLIEAGFEMKKVKGFGFKRDMLSGTLPARQAAASYSPWYARSPASTADDIAIIGGGIASAALITALLQRGKQVTLYCQDPRPAAGASGNHQGAIYPLLNGNNDNLSQFFAPAFLFSRQFIDQQRTRGIPFEHDWCGVTQLGYDEKSAAKLAKMVDGAFPEALVTPLNVDGVSEKVGLETGHAGVFYPLGGWMSPQQFTAGVIDAAIASGQLDAYFGCHVNALTQSDNGWTLDTSMGEVCHQNVVIANGHQADSFSQTQPIPVYPVRGQVSHVPTNTELSKLNTVLCFEGYLTPANQGEEHCLGASYRRNNADLAFQAADQLENQQRLTDCIDTEWARAVPLAEEGRVGVRCASRDHLPFVGNVCDYNALVSTYQTLQKDKEKADAVPVYPGLFCLLGLGSRGLTSAPLAAEVLAAQLCDEPLPLPQSVLDTLHPGRMWVRKLLKGKAL